MSVIHAEDPVGADLQADPATHTFLRVKVQGDNAAEINHSSHFSISL